MPAGADAVPGQAEALGTPHQLVQLVQPPSEVIPPPQAMASVYESGTFDVVPPAAQTDISPVTPGRSGEDAVQSSVPVSPYGESGVVIRLSEPAARVDAAAEEAPVPGAAVSTETIPFGRAEAAPLPLAPSSAGFEWRKVAAAAAVLLFLGGASFGAYWYTRPPQKGALLVQSNVPGIEVVVDGRASGVSPLALELAPGRHVVEMKGHGISRSFAVEISPGVQTTQYVKWPKGMEVGSLKVTSTPVGARVIVDGEPRGATPLTLAEVPIGAHSVVLEHESGTVRGNVRVETNEQSELDLQIYAGWVAVFAPIELRIFAQGRLVGTTNDGRIMMKPGTHELELVNTSLGYRQVRKVEVTPGRVTALSMEEAKGTLQVQAPDGTEVFIDGESAGVMPLGDLSVTVGTHVVVFRHPQQGERRVTVAVSMNAPVRAQMP